MTATEENSTNTASRKPTKYATTTKGDRHASNKHREARPEKHRKLESNKKNDTKP